MQLLILTPEKTVFDGNAESLQLPGSLGLMGVLNNHAPILTGMTPGVVKFKEDNQTNHHFVSGGFFEFSSNRAIILVDAAENPKEIDIERAKESGKRARKRLKEKKGIDMKRAEAALSRSLARQKAHNVYS